MSGLSDAGFDRALDLASTVFGWQHLARYSGMDAEWLDKTLRAIVQSARNDVERIRDEAVGDAKPCTCYPGGFSPETYEGPKEDCEQHGRSYAEWVERGDILHQRVLHAEAAERALVERLLDVATETIYQRIVDHPMWIDGEGEPLGYLPQREVLLGDFMHEVTDDLRAALVAVASTDEETGAAPFVHISDWKPGDSRTLCWHEYAGHESPCVYHSGRWEDHR